MIMIDISRSLMILIFLLAWWKGGTWSELNRTKVYSIVKKLSSAKVGNPLYLNSSHVVRAKPLHLGWWGENHRLYPELALMVRDVLAIPASGCEVERQFS